MKIKNIILMLISIIVLVCGCNIKIFALNTGFLTEDMGDEEYDCFINKFNIQLLNEEPGKEPISCFDVSDNGSIAIGVDILGKKIISIYSLDGEFEYGYKFESTGSYGIEWDGDNLLIYLVRSDLAVSVDPEGNIIDVVEIQNTIENTGYWNKSVRSTTREVNGNIYKIKNVGLMKIFNTSFSQLIAIDSDGNQTILYDVTGEQILYTVVIAIGVVIFVSVVFVYLIKHLKSMTVKRRFEE